MLRKTYSKIEGVSDKNVGGKNTDQNVVNEKMYKPKVRSLQAGQE